MNLFYVSAEKAEYIMTEYALSGFSKCKKCRQNIEKETLRIGICLDDDHYAAKYWYHLNCFTLPVRYKDINPEQSIYQLDQLQPEDQDKVLAYLNKELQEIKAGKRRGLKKKKIENQKDDKKKSKSKSAEKEKEKEKDIPAPKTKKPKKPKKAELVSSGYTKEQTAQYEELLVKYMKLTIDQLKNILGQNLQPKAGTKPELAQKCADGELLGRIPICLNCGGGKLRFNRITGIYKCPGFMDDDVFKNCNKTYGMEEIERTKWG